MMFLKIPVSYLTERLDKISKFIKIMGKKGDELEQN
jgi:hypothetical protein